MRRSSGADALLTTGSALVTFALSGATSIVIARTLGPSRRGDWAVIGSLAMLVGTGASLGLPAAAGFGAARFQDGDRQRFVQSALIASVLLAVLAIGVYAIASEVISPAGVDRRVVLLGGALAAASLLFAVTHQMVLTTSPLMWFALAQVLPALALLAGVIAVGHELGIESVILLSASVSVLGAALSLGGMISQRALGARLVVRRAGELIGTLRPHISFAALTFGTVALTLVVQRVDVLLVAGLRDSRQAGLYAVAVQFGDALLVVPGAIGFLVFRLGAVSAVGHWDQTLGLARATLLVSVPGAAVMALAAPTLVSLLFGSHYAPSVPAVRWLMPGVVLLGLQSVISNYIASRGRPRAVLVAWLLAASLGIGLDLVAIPAFGISGAAAVSSVSYLAVVVLHLRALRDVRPESVPA
jgi:O-antigen/teichoic acid export membrane protein